VAVLKADVGKGLQQLESSATSAAEAVASLVQLDRVKSRMEAAATTLKVPAPKGEKCIYTMVSHIIVDYSFKKGCPKPKHMLKCGWGRENNGSFWEPKIK
jgi:hypothetical protein